MSGRRYGSRPIGRQNTATPQSGDEGDDEKGAPPRMSRSAGQLASSYAPGRHFAFENGLGVCISQPKPGSKPQWLTVSVENQIHWRLHEAFKAWAAQGRDFLLGVPGGADREVALRRMLVDRSFVDEATGQVEYRPEVVGFLSPSEMAYEPSPLTLICGRCGLLRTPGNPEALLTVLTEAELRCLHPVKGPNRKANACDWRQFEPIFVHPSGAWRSISADLLDHDDQTGQPYKRHASCEKCSSTDFVVDTTKATLTGWFLRCARCGVKRSVAWTDHDEEMLSLLDRPGINRDDARMEKISYGAAAAYSVQAETFVNLQAEILECLEEHRSEDLKRFIVRRTGQFGPLPLPTEVADRLEAGGLQGNAAVIAGQLRILLGLLDRAVDQTSRQSIETLLDTQVRQAVEAGLVELDLRLSGTLEGAVARRRRDWAPKYDPFRLLVEHQALKDVKLAGTREGSRSTFVPFRSPDERLRPWREEAGQEADSGRRDVEVSLWALGVEEAGLIPNFDLVRFTYGYSRTSSSPRPQRPDKKMPVRLNLFPKTQVDGQHQHPVYVLRQMNEAFYFRLDEGAVREWLSTIDCVDAHLLDRHGNLAAVLLESACTTPMDRFLTGHREIALASDPRPPELYTMAYGLLHSMSHHVIRTVSRLSGLDEGALGEYLFPADLAFVVFRSGMTMDLGDLSSLWRNCWSAFLNELRDYPTTLGCGIGSLCSEQGGACPDCLMLPEVCCVAGNRYLSRSLLTGDGLPTFADIPGNVLTGFLEAVARRPAPAT